MKILLTLFVLLFSSSVLADDISDFQIEGISLGDSALDFFSEEEIKNNLKNYYNDKTYSVAEIEFLPSFKVYDAIQIHFKTFDKNYIVHSVVGFLDYPNNIHECYDKKNEIYDEIAFLFPNMKNNEFTTPHPGDKSGKSVVSVSEYYNEEVFIRVACYDWSKEMGYIDSLNVAIERNDFLKWVTDKGLK